MKCPGAHHSDSFYFAGKTLILHNKATYTYEALRCIWSHWYSLGLMELGNVLAVRRLWTPEPGCCLCSRMWCHIAINRAVRVAQIWCCDEPV